MIFLAAHLSIFLLQVKLHGSSTIKFADNSYIPIKPDFIEDASIESCTGFQNNNGKAEHGYTQFRITLSDLNAYYFSVTVTGKRLGCGRGLYLSPLSVGQLETWLGLWTTCILTARSYNSTDETCSYCCMAPFQLKEIQVMRVPQSLTEFYWELCNIDITVNNSCGENKVYSGCADISSNRSGVYRIKVSNTNTYSDIYCDETTQGGGWTVLLRRFDGSGNYNRDWEEYKSGFGQLTGEFWAGNEIMHKITTDGQTYLLRVELESFEGDFFYAEYSNFSVGPESDNYTLHVSGYLSTSTAGDSMGYQNGMMFSTPARDNTPDSSNCSRNYGCGWWYNKCHKSLLTGKYGKNYHYGHGITWYTLWKHESNVRYTRMMIRPIK